MNWKKIIIYHGIEISQLNIPLTWCDMNYSCKQKQVIGYLNQVDSATINEIYNNVSFRYYHNYKKHLGALLSRMVKSGKIKRVKRGLYSKVSLKIESFSTRAYFLEFS